MCVVFAESWHSPGHINGEGMGLKMKYKYGELILGSHLIASDRSLYTHNHMYFNSRKNFKIVRTLQCGHKGKPS